MNNQSQGTDRIKSETQEPRSHATPLSGLDNDRQPDDLEGLHDDVENVDEDTETTSPGNQDVEGTPEKPAPDKRYPPPADQGL